LSSRSAPRSESSLWVECHLWFLAFELVRALVRRILYVLRWVLQVERIGSHCQYKTSVTALWARRRVCCSVFMVICGDVFSHSDVDVDGDNSDDVDGGGDDEGAPHDDGSGVDDDDGINVDVNEDVDEGSICVCGFCTVRVSCLFRLVSQFSSPDGAFLFWLMSVFLTFWRPSCVFDDVNGGDLDEAGGDTDVAIGDDDGNNGDAIKGDAGSDGGGGDMFGDGDVDGDGNDVNKVDVEGGEEGGPCVDGDDVDDDDDDVDDCVCGEGDISCVCGFGLCTIFVS
jgi:hypothetical protein